MTLTVLTVSLLFVGQPAEGAVPVVTMDAYKAARQQLDAALRERAVIYADLPKPLQAEVDRSNAAYSAADFATAVAALREPTAWARAVVVDQAFVQEKHGRAVAASQPFLRSPSLTEEQARGIHGRLDRAAEALNADNLGATNLLLNDLFDYLKSLPTPKPPTPEP